MGLIIGQGTKSGGGGGGDVRLETNHNATISENGTHVVTPQEGYDGMRKATINVDVEAADPTDKALVNNATQYGLSHNLYKVMEQVKADPRTQGYAAIMLCQYYKGYNSLSLEGGANAFLTSDGDFYQGNATHYWHDSNDEMFDRWVAMLFSSESGNYSCSNANICPRSVLVDGKLGIISAANEAMRWRWIDVTDGSSFTDFYPTGDANTSTYDTELLIRGFENHSHNTIQLNNIFYANIGVEKISGGGFNEGSTSTGTLLMAKFDGLKSISGNGNLFWATGGMRVLWRIVADELISANKIFIASNTSNPVATNLKFFYCPKLVELGNFCGTSAGVITNVNIGWASLIHFEIGQGFFSNLNLRMCSFTNCLKTDANDLVEDASAHPTWSNLDQFLHNFEHLIVDKLADLSGQTAKTITLAAAPYAAITSEIRSKMSAKNWNLARA